MFSDGHLDVGTRPVDRDVQAILKRMEMQARSATVERPEGPPDLTSLDGITAYIQSLIKRGERDSEAASSVWDLLQTRHFGPGLIKNIHLRIEYLRAVCIRLQMTDLGRPSKKSVERHLKDAIFFLMAQAYHEIYQKRPDVKDSERGPFGPATLWCQAIVKIAVGNWSAYLAELPAADRRPIDEWLKTFSKTIYYIGYVSLTTLSKRM